MTWHHVEAVWVFKYSESHFKAIYGRRFPGGGSSSFSKDFLQISGECREEFERVIGRGLVPGDEVEFRYRWPDGEMKGKIRHTSDRLSLRWPTSGSAPAPWRLALAITPNHLETFEGNPNLPSAQDAEAEWKRFEATNQEPWLVVVKLADEPDALHLRAYLGRPLPHLDHASTNQLPFAVRSVMTDARPACRAIKSLRDGSQRLWFDPARNRDAFTDNPKLAESQQVTAGPAIPLQAHPIPVESVEPLPLGGIEEDISEETIIQEQKGLQERLGREPALTEGLDRETTRISARPRNAAFRRTVTQAYSYQCAVCGSKLRAPDGQPEVQAAHIYPKSQDGSDDPRNGLCLCRQHHWALDTGWIAISDDRRVLAHPTLPDTDQYTFIRDYVGKELLSPNNDRMAPDPLYLRHHRELHGFDFE